MNLWKILQTVSVISAFLMMTEVTDDVIARVVNQTLTANCSCMISKLCFGLKKSKQYCQKVLNILSSAS